MEFARCTLFLAILASQASIIQARGSMRKSPADEPLQAKHVVAGNVTDEKADISPELKPAADKVFFKKDYPSDNQPKADPFHFAHPYPVVQDSGDFDKDFVKDENKDNGNWEAQDRYDRLRSKLAKEKRDLAAALERKDTEARELEEAKKRHAEEQQKKTIAQKKAEKIRKARRDRLPAPIIPKGKDGTAPGSAPITSKGKDGTAPGSAPPAPQAQSSSENDEEAVDEAAEETKDAVDKLEDCKKKLAEARKRLKDVMKELEEKKAVQQKADSAADAAEKKELAAGQLKNNMHERVDDAHKAYQEAKKKYEKANAQLEEYKAQIEVASNSVKDMRRKEDKDGGVYPKHEKSKGLTASSPRIWMLAFLVGLIASGV